MTETSVDLINKSTQRLTLNSIETHFLLAPNNTNNDAALKLKRSFFGDIWDASAKAKTIKSPTQYSVDFVFGKFDLNRLVLLTRNGETFTVQLFGDKVAKAEVFQDKESEGHILRVIFPSNNSTFYEKICSYETQLEGVVLLVGPIRLLQFYQSETSSSPPEPPESLVGLYNKSDCPRIFIQASTDYFSGLNMAQVVYTLLDTQSNQKLSKFSNFPNFTLVARGKGCTLIEKIIWAVDNDIISNVEYYQYLARMTLYGTLRLFLWKLITGIWDIKILLRENTKKFFSALLESRFACFIEVFTSTEIRGFDKAFLKTLKK